MLAAETTREKLTLRLHQELPYELTVETEGWEERKDGSVKIDQVVYVARDGHKGIALGPKGATIKAIGQAARAEIEAFLGREVHLFLTVKVRPELAGRARALRRDGARLPRGRRLSAPAADRRVLGAGLPRAAAPRGYPGLCHRARRRHGRGGDGQARHARRAGAGLRAQLRRGGRAGLGRSPRGRRRRWTRRWRGSGGMTPTSG